MCSGSLNQEVVNSDIWRIPAGGHCNFRQRVVRCDKVTARHGRPDVDPFKASLLQERSRSWYEMTGAAVHGKGGNVRRRFSSPNLPPLAQDPFRCKLDNNSRRSTARATSVHASPNPSTMRISMYAGFPVFPTK